MSNTVYIDVNTKNSVNVNSTNNRFEYRLPNVMDLPTGTEIGLQSSIINLKGINGASVEINEDIEETIIYQYYSVDTTYDYPVQKPVGAVANLIDYNLVVDLSTKHNILNEFPAATDVLSQDQLNNLSFAGYTENIMPLVTQVTSPDGVNVATPVIGKSKIFIKKGIYAIEKLATKISEQINVNRLIDSDNDDTGNQDFYSFRKENETWRGFFVNNSTCRNFKLQSIDRWKDVAAGTTNPDDGAIFKYLPFNRLGALDFTQVSIETDLADQREGICDVIGVTPSTNDVCRLNAANGGFDAANIGAGPNQFGKICVTGNPQARYFQGFEAANGYTNPDNKRNYTTQQYDPFYTGLAFGTTGFQLAYDTNNSGYSLSKLHQPRRIPTIDRFGTNLQNAGQECIFNKTPVDQYQIDIANPTVIKALTAVMSRTTGILVTNWAFDSASKLGDKTFAYNKPNLTNAEKTKCNEYRLFEEFFTTEDKAKQAWESTVWARLGFQYNDISNPNKNGSAQTNVNWYGTNQTVQGFTTDQNRDQSILPNISTIYNPLSENKQDARIRGSTDSSGTAINTPPFRGALPAVSNVQFFNMAGNSVPVSYYNNDLAAGALNVAAFQGSVYKRAVMVPVITTAKDFTATKLPTLSKNGYMVITSDLVEPVDVLKNQQNTGILDIIPKSNLSNQDYVADRNILTHTLSNPKQINTISMAVLNPDMTDIDLEPDSSFLFKISIPIPKPTNFLAQTAQAAKAQQVSGALGAIIQKSTDQGKQGTNLRMDVSNIIGGGSGGDGIPDEDLNEIEAVLDAQAGLGVPALQQEPFERDPNYRPPQFEPDLPPIEEALAEQAEEPAPAGRGRPRRQFGGDPARAAASLMRSGALNQPRRVNPIRQREAQERELGEVLTNLESQLAISEDRLRDPRLAASEYQQLLNRRNQIEQTIQQLSARGIQGVADPTPQQLQQAAQGSQPPQDPE